MDLWKYGERRFLRREIFRDIYYKLSEILGFFFWEREGEGGLSKRRVFILRMIKV